MKRKSVLALLAALAIITFLDRIGISVAGARIQRDLNISAERWGWILGAFVLAYGIFEIPTGALGDRSGHANVLTRIVLWWSAFTCLTGLASGFKTLLVARFLFGAGEAGAYPNIAGVIARWFSATERAQTQGIIWAASRFGGALSPLIVVPLQARVGWRAAFAILGMVGVLWVLCWKALYRDLPAVAAAVQVSPLKHEGVPWAELLSRPQLWLIFAMYFSQAWGSWFYFGWFPVYLVKGAGFTESQMGIFSGLPFLMGAAGCLLGGFLSDRLTARFGLSIGRKLVPCLSLAASGLLLIAMTLTRKQAAIVVLSSLGFGLADLMLPAAWAICLDIAGPYAGVVTGTMNTAGQLGGFVCAVSFGYAVQAAGNYQTPVWIVAAMVIFSAALFWRIDPAHPLIRE